MYGMEDDVGTVAHAKLEAVVALQFLALHALAVYESPVLARLIEDPEPAVFGGDRRVISGNSRVRDHQVLVDLAAHRERAMVEDDRALLAPLHQYQRRERAG